MYSPKLKSYLLISMLFFSASTSAIGGKKQPPAKATVEKVQQSALVNFVWFNVSLFKN